jgi:hypothetical protein
MIADQQDFTQSLFRVVEDDPRVERFVAWLAGRGWVTAAMVHEALDWSDRDVRALAEASDGRVISGQKGYKLTREANPDEANQAADWLKNQAAKMTARAVKIQRVFHAHHLPKEAGAQ